MSESILNLLNTEYSTKLDLRKGRIVLKRKHMAPYSSLRKDDKCCSKDALRAECPLHCWIPQNHPQQIPSTTWSKKQQEYLEVTHRHEVRSSPSSVRSDPNTEGEGETKERGGRKVWGREREEEEGKEGVNRAPKCSTIYEQSQQWHPTQQAMWPGTTRTLFPARPVGHQQH